MRYDVSSYLMRFFDVILGAATAAPIKLLPVMRIPLCDRRSKVVSVECVDIYNINIAHHAAPNTDSPKALATPSIAHK